ncbi:MAG: NAD(P)-binding protein [Caenibius sp.]
MHPCYDVIILGGGIAGLSAASILSDKFQNILLIDSFPQLGGTQHSIDTNGYTFDIGSYFFYPRSILFERHPTLLESTLPAPCSSERIRPDGTISSYPFASRELREYSLWEKGRFFFSLMNGKLTIWDEKNLEQSCHRMIGKAFYEHSGLSNYVARFYGPDLPAARISPIFVDKRLQFLRNRTRFGSALKTIQEGYFRKVVQPTVQGDVGRVRAEAGFPAMYAPVADDLVRKGVTIKLNQCLQGIRQEKSGFRVMTSEGELRALQIVSTLPIQVLLNLIEKGADFILPSGPLLTLCVSFKGNRGFDGGVLFNFHDQGRWKRLTMHSDFYGLRHNREYFSVEVPVSDNQVVSDTEAFADFLKSVQSHGLFKGDLQLEDSAYTQFAYPRYELGYEKALDDALAIVDDFGIITAGRQGRFDYLPTSGLISRQVEMLLKPMASGGVT